MSQSSREVTHDIDSQFEPTHTITLSDKQVSQSSRKVTHDIDSQFEPTHTITLRDK